MPAPKLKKHKSNRAVSPKKRSSAPKRSEILSTAREKFGYGQLRLGQEEAINSVLSGKDTLVVMPTGSGKSAIYQIAGLMLPGLVVMVSPLIALQKDQTRREVVE